MAVILVHASAWIGSKEHVEAMKLPYLAVELPARALFNGEGSIRTELQFMLVPCGDCTSMLWFW
eukprot:1861420-Amphidinium_carterae.1